MDYLLDTSILVDFLTHQRFFEKYEHLLDFSKNNLFVCSVSKGELLGIGKMRGWDTRLDKKQLNAIELLFEKLICVDVTLKHTVLHNAYADIVAFGRCKKVREHQLKKGVTMGQNDMWIAASAIANRTTLVVADRDFDHLNGIFLPVLYIEPPTDKFPKKK